MGMTLEGRFRQVLTALACELVVVRGGAGAAEAVVRALTARGVTEVVAWSDPWLQELGVGAAVRRAGIQWFVPPAGIDPAAVRRAAARAGAGVTSADWGVAETGTLVLMAGPGRPRVTHLLPPLHIALLKADRLLPDTAALFRVLSEQARTGAMPSALQWVTGPSRTADIGHSLVRGAHGPREVLVVLVH